MEVLLQLEAETKELFGRARRAEENEEMRSNKGLSKEFSEYVRARIAPAQDNKDEEDKDEEDRELFLFFSVTGTYM